MSGTEITGAISSVFTIVEKVQDLYAYIIDACGASQTVQDAGQKLPVIQGVLQRVRATDTEDEDACARLQLAAGLVQQCDTQAKALEEILAQVQPASRDATPSELWTLSRKQSKIKSLLQALTDSVYLLGTNVVVKGQTGPQVDEARELLQQLSGPHQSKTENHTFNSFGIGTQNNNNYGSGKVFNGHTMYFTGE